MSVGSYKNAAILLSGLFIYDGEFSKSEYDQINCEPSQAIPDLIMGISLAHHSSSIAVFWVFGTDVMVTVAKSFDAPIKVMKI